MSKRILEGADYIPCLLFLYLFEFQKCINIIKMNLSQKIEVVRKAAINALYCSFFALFIELACLSIRYRLYSNKMHKYYFLN